MRLNQKRNSSDETHDFYANIEKDRMEFYLKSEKSVKTSTMRFFNKTRDFNEYMKMKNDEFTEQMRGYRPALRRGEKEIACPRRQWDQENPKLPEPPADN